MGGLSKVSGWVGNGFNPDRPPLTPPSTGLLPVSLAVHVSLCLVLSISTCTPAPTRCPAHYYKLSDDWKVNYLPTHDTFPVPIPVSVPALGLPLTLTYPWAGGLCQSRPGVSSRGRIFPWRVVPYGQPTHQPSNSPCCHTMPPCHQSYHAIPTCIGCACTG